MRKLLVLIAIVFATATTVAQDIVKFEAIQATSRLRNDDRSWSEWNKWKDFRAMIFINLDDMTMTVYGGHTIVYHIIREKKVNDKNLWDCVDSDGNEFELQMVNETDGENSLIFYLWHKDYSFAYYAFRKK